MADSIESYSEELSERDNKEMYRMVIRHYESDKKYRDNRKLPEMFEKMERFYRNDYWRGSGRPKHLSRLTSNILFEGVEVMLPIVVSRPPSPEVIAEPDNLDPSQIDEIDKYAKQVQRELKKIWKDDRLQDKMHQAFREHSVKGKMVMKSTFDSESGKIKNEVCDILTLYPDRYASSLAECFKSHFIHARYMNVMDIKDKYGITVKPEGDFDENDNFIYYTDQIGGGVSGAVNRVRDFVTGEEHRSDGRSLVLEYYCGDPERMEEQYEDYDYDDSGKRKKETDGSYKMKTLNRMKYPNGKVITIVRNHKDKVVECRPNVYPHLPFFETTNHKRTNDFWGLSDGTNIETHVLAINQAMSNRNDNLRFIGNPDVEVLEGSGIEEVTNEPGAVYHSAIPNAIRKMSPPPMGSDSQRFIDDMRNDSDRILGLSDAFRGQGSSGDSGLKTQSLIAQATGRLQPKVSEFVNLSRELYKHWAYIIQNFYPESILQVINDGDSDTVSYDEFIPDQFSGVSLNIDVSSSSMLPFDKYAEFQEAQVLLEAGAISPEQFIDLCPSLRDKQRAKEHVRQQKAQAEQQQQMEQQMMAQQQQAEQQAQQVPNEEGLSPEEQIMLGSNDPEQIQQVLANKPELVG
jgi:hypothetical protein